MRDKRAYITVIYLNALYSKCVQINIFKIFLYNFEFNVNLVRLIFKKKERRKERNIVVWYMEWK